MSELSTPLMRQYAAIKKEHPNALLFFRLGDFYELFFDDAVLAARELQITLTSRNKEKGIAIPMCGVPYHAAEGYISKLIRRGFKVAVCEQVEDPRAGKEAGAPRGHTGSDSGYRRRLVLECGREQFSGGGGNHGRTRWLCRPRSLDWRISRHRIFAEKPPRAGFKKNSNNCGQKNCCTALPHHSLKAEEPLDERQVSTRSSSGPTACPIDAQWM